MRNIYAVRDRIAKDFVGNQMYVLLVFRTDQQAVRYFADAINDESSVLHKHPADYELVKLGHLEEGNLSEPLLTAENEYTVVITGDNIIAAQTAQAEKLKLEA